MSRKRRDLPQATKSPAAPGAAGGEARVSRRSALATMAIATAGIAFGVSCKRSQSTGSSTTVGAGECLPGSDLGSNVSAGEWVGNSKTKTLHHTTVCQKHLPASGSSVAFGDETRSYCVHRSDRAAIHEAVANGQIRAGDFEGAIGTLRMALAASPLSIHLYDRVISLHGRLRQFDPIRSLLADASQSVGQMQGRSASESRKLARARAELALRLARTERRAGGGGRSAPAGPGPASPSKLPPAPPLGG